MAPPRAIPVDDESLTTADIRQLRESEEAFRRGDYVTLDELKADVARLRSAKTRTRPAAAAGERSKPD